MADLFPLNPYGFIDGSPIDPTTLPEVANRVNTGGRPVYIPMQARPEYYNYKNGLRIPFDKIPSTTQAVPVGAPYGTQGVPVGEPYGPKYPTGYKGRPNLPSGPVNPRTYPVIESSRYLPTSVSTPSKFGWLKSGVRALGPLGTATTVGTTAYSVGDAVNNYFGLSDKLIGNAGKGDLSELTRSAEVIKTPGQGSTYNGEISDAEFNSMSHQEKLNWLADRNQYRRDLAANYVPASPTATNEYGEGKTPTGNVVLGSDTPTDAMLPDGTMVHDGVTVAPTVPTVDNLIATANKPRVANRVANGVANRTPVTTPTTPPPTFNYSGSAPTYASSYNLNRDPNYQYSEAYAWRNNPTPTPWNNGWAKPNPRASSTTNYYAGIGY